ncbi:Pectinesterase inhibitor domain [Sesbania bispinosa]|nr:Pectinesterase inhibitor domain [Sesbania bispinosa]
MAFQSASFSFVLLFTLLFLFNFTFASSTDSVSHKQIKAICGQTQNPDFCITSLEGYLGDEKANLNKLGIVSILLATSQARLNKYVVEQLIQTMVNLDPTTKTHLEKCQVDYDVTLDKLQSAYRLSDKKDYKGMVKFVYDADMMTNACTIECMQLQDSLSPWKEENQKMVWLNNIALVILGMLKK